MFWMLCLVLGMPYLQQDGPKSVLYFGLMTAVVLGSILWHELGHAWARERFGAPWSEITLYGFGGLCSGPGRFTRGQGILIAAAGPAASLCLGALTYLLGQIGSYQPWVLFVIAQMLWVNIGWAVLNLLPIYPLDGGQIAAGIAGPRGIKVVVWMGLVCATTLAVLTFAMGYIFSAAIFAMLAWENWKRSKK